jgi:hypothetical protein
MSTALPRARGGHPGPGVHGGRYRRNVRGRVRQRHAALRAHPAALDNLAGVGCSDHEVNITIPPGSVPPWLVHGFGRGLGFGRNEVLAECRAHLLKRRRGVPTWRRGFVLLGKEVVELVHLERILGVLTQHRHGVGCRWRLSATVSVILAHDAPPPRRAPRHRCALTRDAATRWNSANDTPTEPLHHHPTPDPASPPRPATTPPPAHRGATPVTPTRPAPPQTVITCAGRGRGTELELDRQSPYL